MDEIQRLKRCLEDSERNVNNLKACQAVADDSIRLRQSAKVLASLLHGRSILQKGITDEYDKQEKLISQIAILEAQGCKA